MTEPEQPMVYLFGFRDLMTVRIDPTPIGKFLMGGEVPLDGELAQAIRIEFHAQEQYRLHVLKAVQKICGEVLSEACANVAAIEHPITDLQVAFWRGVALGRYEAYSAVAAMLSEIQVVAAMGVEPERGDDDDRAEEGVRGEARSEPG